MIVVLLYIHSYNTISINMTGDKHWYTLVESRERGRGTLQLQTHVNSGEVTLGLSEKE